DGCDPIAAYEVMSRAVAYCRARKGPALVHAHVIRPYSHSLSDDEVMYRPTSEREADARKDPVTRFPASLIADGIATPEEIAAIEAEVTQTVEAATEAALPSPQPAIETA